MSLSPTLQRSAGRPCRLCCAHRLRAGRRRQACRPAAAARGPAAVQQRRRKSSALPFFIDNHNQPVHATDRKSSLSIDGKSSWMSDMVWIISREQAVGIACSMVPPTSSHAARHSAGRTRLPPAARQEWNTAAHACSARAILLRACVLPPATRRCQRALQHPALHMTSRPPTRARSTHARPVLLPAAARGAAGTHSCSSFRTPARREYRMASLMTSGYCSGTLLSRAASISTARSFMYKPKSKAGPLALATADSGRTVTSATQRGRCRAGGNKGGVGVGGAPCSVRRPRILQRRHPQGGAPRRGAPGRPDGPLTCASRRLPHGRRLLHVRRLRLQEGAESTRQVGRC